MANPIQKSNHRPSLWDCGTTLHHSFELESFQKQLYSAIYSRSLPMPHLPDRRSPLAVEVAPPLPPPVDQPKKSPSKISRSLNKFLKLVFKSRQNKSPRYFRMKDGPGEQYCLVYDKSGALSTIPEAPEIDLGAVAGLSPENISSLARRSEEESFTAASMMGISCA